jgi:hypothetical protein
MPAQQLAVRGLASSNSTKNQRLPVGPACLHMAEGLEASRARLCADVLIALVGCAQLWVVLEAPAATSRQILHQKQAEEGMLYMFAHQQCVSLNGHPRQTPASLKSLLQIV